MIGEFIHRKRALTIIKPLPIHCHCSEHAAVECH